MATILQCDACGKQVDGAGRDKDEWSFLSIAKHTNQGTPFAKHELCDVCTGSVRRLLQTMSTTRGAKE